MRRFHFHGFGVVRQGPGITVENPLALFSAPGSAIEDAVLAVFWTWFVPFRTADPIDNDCIQQAVSSLTASLNAVSLNDVALGPLLTAFGGALRNVRNPFAAQCAPGGQCSVSRCA